MKDVPRIINDHNDYAMLLAEYTIMLMGNMIFNNIKFTDRNYESVEELIKGFIDSATEKLDADIIIKERGAK